MSIFIFVVTNVSEGSSAAERERCRLEKRASAGKDESLTGLSALARLIAKEMRFLLMLILLLM
ncbi:hypothetical protein [Wenzhouxiangella sp. EGI_FJ10305]|uniref:hypothetical protein n=1 Tax=Wenzhouxiangella sp. EGI_FJ10305 TaxID=3243768 RepID=UPI0035D7DA1C